MLLEMSLAEVKSFHNAMSLKYCHRFYLMGRSRMGLTSDWTIYLTGLMVSPGVMSHLVHAALPWTRMTSVPFNILFIQACLFKAIPSQEEAGKTVLLLFFIGIIYFAVMFSQVEGIIKATLKSCETSTETSNWTLCCWRTLFYCSFIMVFVDLEGFLHPLRGTKWRKRTVLRDMVVITFSWLLTLLYVICIISSERGKIILQYSICKWSY